MQLTYTSVFLLLLSFFIAELPAQEAKGNLSYTTQSDILYRDSLADGFTAYMQERCRLDVYYPENTAGFPTVVWFHGGGLKAGNRYTPQELQNQGIAVVAVNYRLNPNVECPAYIEDAAASVAWVFEHIAEFGGNPDLIFVSGHSAGGYLASMIGLDKRWLEPYEIDSDRIAGMIPYSGHAITHFTIRSERGLKWSDVVVDEYAPLAHVRADAPPLILITGDRELELYGRHEEVAYLMRMMKTVGHPYTELYELDGYNHGAMDEPAHHILLTHLRKIVASHQKE